MEGQPAVQETLVGSDEAYFSSLVLSDLVLGVLLAGLALAIGAASFWNVDLFHERKSVPLSLKNFAAFRFEKPALALLPNCPTATTVSLLQECLFWKDRRENSVEDIPRTALNSCRSVSF